MDTKFVSEMATDFQFDFNIPAVPLRVFGLSHKHLLSETSRHRDKSSYFHIYLGDPDLIATIQPLSWGTISYAKTHTVGVQLVPWLY